MVRPIYWAASNDAPNSLGQKKYERVNFLIVNINLLIGAPNLLGQNIISASNIAAAKGWFRFLDCLRQSKTYTRFCCYMIQGSCNAALLFGKSFEFSLNTIEIL